MNIQLEVTEVLIKPNTYNKITVLLDGVDESELLHVVASLGAKKIIDLVGTGEFLDAIGSDNAADYFDLKEKD